MIRASRPRAFTLIELLVVVGIIALLVAMLVPTLSKVRSQARTAQCASNLKEIYQAAQLWRTDDPNTQMMAAGWGARFGKYAGGGGHPKVFVCPENQVDFDINVGMKSPYSLSSLAVRVTSGSGSHDLPLAPDPDDPEVMHASQRRVMELNGTKYGDKTYTLGFENQPRDVTASVETGNFNDAVIKVTINDDNTATVVLESASYEHNSEDLVDAASDKVLMANLGKAGGTLPGDAAATITVMASTPELYYSYGINKYADRVMGHGGKVLGMDYRKEVIDHRGDSWTGTWIGNNGTPAFNRHLKRTNILKGDGSVVNEAVLSGNEYGFTSLPSRWQ